VLFIGDVMMPYLGQPFAGEGSPEGLLETLAFIGTLHPGCSSRAIRRSPSCSPPRR